MFALGIAVAVAVAAAAALAGAAGSPISGGAIGGAVGGGVGVMLIAASRGKTCPVCAAELPLPQTGVDQPGAVGVWTCTSCGAEVEPTRPQRCGGPRLSR